MRKVLLLLPLLVFSVTAIASAADVAGNWTVNMTGRRGAETLDLAIKANGNDLTISGKHSTLGDMKGSGTLNGNNIVMSVIATGERKLGYKLEGTVTGDKMAGTLEIDRSSMGGGGARGGGATGGARGGGAAEGGARGGGAGGDRSSTSNEWTAERK
jgi:hypothetical protein